MALLRIEWVCLKIISPEQSQAPYGAGNIQQGISNPCEIKKRFHGTGVEGKNKMSGKEKKFNLQERLIDYAVRIIHVSEQLPDTKAGKHVSSQMLRSGTSPAANYGEAQSAESKADFIYPVR